MDPEDPTTSSLARMHQELWPNGLWQKKISMIIWWGLHDVIRTYIKFNISRINWASRVAQRKRAGPITQRSEDQNLALLGYFSFPIFSNFFLIPFFFYPLFFAFLYFYFYHPGGSIGSWTQPPRYSLQEAVLGKVSQGWYCRGTRA